MQKLTIALLVWMALTGYGLLIAGSVKMLTTLADKALRAVCGISVAEYEQWQTRRALTRSLLEWRADPLLAPQIKIVNRLPSGDLDTQGLEA